jgi:hypothetical protein
MPTHHPPTSPTDTLAALEVLVAEAVLGWRATCPRGLGYPPTFVGAMSAPGPVPRAGTYAIPHCATNRGDARLLWDQLSAEDWLIQISGCGRNSAEVVVRLEKHYGGEDSVRVAAHGLPLALVLAALGTRGIAFAPDALARFNHAASTCARTDAFPPTRSL